ncbi:MAG: RNA methyltransferase [Clostridia bacterium]|nr:RNA methyltransferase [Clostridia bacterium]
MGQLNSGSDLREIASPRNPAVRYYRECAGGEREGLIGLEGARLVADAISAGVRVREVYTTVAAADSGAGSMVLGGARARGIEVVAISQSVADRMADTRTPQGVFATAEWGPMSGSEILAHSRVAAADGVGAWSFIVLLDGVADPGNVGTISRTAAALGTAAIVAGPGCARLGSPKVLRASMGALFRLPVAAEPDLEGFLLSARSYGYHVMASEVSGGIPVGTLSIPRAQDGLSRSLLVIGSEALGISSVVRGIADAFVTIPMARNVESLNAASAAAILIYEISRKSLGNVLQNM